MTPTLNKMQVSFQEKMTELQSKLKKLEADISQAEQFILANPGHKLAMSRYNLLYHSRSETLTKIRKLKERMG